jgi:hypothetical protein
MNPYPLTWHLVPWCLSEGVATQSPQAVSVPQHSASPRRKFRPSVRLNLWSLEPRHRLRTGRGEDDLAGDVTYKPGAAAR